MVKTETTIEYLKQYAPAKRLIRFMTDTHQLSTNEAEKRNIANTILEKERLVDEIYNLVFRLPVGLEVVILNLRYIEDMSVKEVCLTLHISKATYHKHHRNAIQLIEEMRSEK